MDNILKIAFVPALLGIAALLWFTFGSDLHFFRRAIRQEERHAEIVKALPLPTKAIDVQIKEKKNACIAIDRAEIDGGELWVYWHSQCFTDDNAFVVISWRGLAPDRTIVVSDQAYAMAGAPVSAGDKAEFHRNIQVDPRMVTLEVSINAH